MNELTGAFLIAQAKGENLLFTRQSLANAGYQVQEIEEALMEANQITTSKNFDLTKEAIPVKKSKLWIWISIPSVFFLIVGIFLFIFRKQIFAIG